MIELLDGFWVDPFSVKVIKSISESKCALWVDGQSAVEGFVLDYAAQDVVDAVLDARERADEGPEEEDDENDEE